MFKTSNLSVKKVFLYKTYYIKGSYWFNWHKKPLFQISDLWSNNTLTKIQSYKVKSYFSIWDLVNIRFLEITKNLIDVYEESENYKKGIHPVMMLPNSYRTLPNLFQKTFLRNNLMQILITAVLSFSIIYNTFFYKPFYF